MTVLHIGNGETVRIRDIVGIFDLDSVTVAGLSRRFLSEAEKNGQVTDCAGGEIPRSVLLLSDSRKKQTTPGDYRVLFSLLSSSALRARIESGENRD